MNYETTGFLWRLQTYEPIHQKLQKSRVGFANILQEERSGL